MHIKNNEASFALSICGSQLYFVYQNVTLTNVKLMLGHWCVAKNSPLRLEQLGRYILLIRNFIMHACCHKYVTVSDCSQQS